MNLLELFFHLLALVVAGVVDSRKEFILFDALWLSFVDDNLLVLEMLVDGVEIALHGLHDFVDILNTLGAVFEEVRDVGLPSECVDSRLQVSVHGLDVVGHERALHSVQLRLNYVLFEH